MSEHDAVDVVPESENEQEEYNLGSVMYEQEQARMMDEQNKLRAICIENGDDAERFVSSNFGQYLIGQAELESEQAKEALTSVDPEDTKTIRALQGRIKRSRSLKSWIVSAIEQGNNEYDEYLQTRNLDEG